MKPTHLHEFIGQDDIIDTVDVFLRAAKSRGEMLDHVLLYGPPGLGKTTLANIVANEMGVGFQSIAAPAISKTADLASVLSNVREPHVLFVDEIHRLSPAVEEMLYSAMDERKLGVLIGEGVTARTMTIQLPPFTLVGATTRLSLLGAPFRERFGIHLRLDFYSEEALCTIIQHAAHAMDLVLINGAELSIARRARGTPRIALRLLRRVRDFANVAAQNAIDKEMCEGTLSQLGVDNLGLDHSDRKYLDFIFRHYRDSCVGINTIATGLSERKETLEDTVEPYLIKLGLIKKTNRGRLLTKRALEVLHSAQ